MNKELKTKIDDFIQGFLELDSVKLYFKLKDEIKNSNEINKLQNDIIKAKKQLALSFGTSNYDENKIRYEKLTNEYYSHPLIMNFEVVKEEINSLLLMIEKYLKM